MPPELRRASVVVILGSIMSILDTTIVAVALATLGRDFHVSVTTIQWVTTGYLLALALVIPVTGWAVDRFGAKSVVVSSKTTILKTVSAKAAAITVKECAFVRGASSDNGLTVAASSVGLSAPTKNGCSARPGRA